MRKRKDLFVMELKLEILKKQLRLLEEKERRDEMDLEDINEMIEMEFQKFKQIREKIRKELKEDPSLKEFISEEDLSIDELLKKVS